jgi:hypothetical protein
MDAPCVGLFSRPGVSPDELLAARILPISRNALYEALARGDIESFRIGKKIVIPTAPLRRKLGLAAE